MKKSLSVILSLSLIALFGYGCDGDSTITVEDPGYISGTSDAELYSPTTITATVGATTMSAGYTQALGNVEWLSRKLAETGYVVLAFTPTNNLGLVSDWRDAHKNCITKLKNINSKKIFY